MLFVLHVGEWIVTVFFTIEMVVQMVHLSLFQRGGYFRSFGKLFDLTIVAASWAGMFLKRSSGTNAMRSLRMLRLVREFKRFEKMQAIISAVSEALELFRDVIGLLMFSLLTFCTIGPPAYCMSTCQHHSSSANDAIMRRTLPMRPSAVPNAACQPQSAEASRASASFRHALVLWAAFLPLPNPGRCGHLRKHVGRTGPGAHSLPGHAPMSG